MQPQQEKKPKYYRLVEESGNDGEGDDGDDNRYDYNGGEYALVDNESVFEQEYQGNLLYSNMNLFIYIFEFWKLKFNHFCSIFLLIGYILSSPAVVVKKVGLLVISLVFSLHFAVMNFLLQQSALQSMNSTSWTRAMRTPRKKSPVILVHQENYKNKTIRKDFICIDSGADTSLFHLDFINNLNPTQVKWGKQHNIVNRDAQGNVIPTCERIVSFKLKVNLLNKKSAWIAIENAMVAKDIININLLGWSDITLNRLKLSYNLENNPEFELRNKGYLDFFKINSEPESAIVSENSLQVVPSSWNSDCESMPNDGITLLDIQNSVQQANELLLDIMVDNIVKTIIIPKSSNKLSFNTSSPIEISTEKILNSSHANDVEMKIMHHIEKIAAKNKATFSISEVKIDPNNELIPPGNKGIDMKNQILNILNKYPKVFRGDIGCVEAPQFVVRANIDINNSLLSSDKGPCYFSRYPASVIEQLETKLNKELADGVLQRVCTSGFVPLNFIPIFPVDKKDDDIILTDNNNNNNNDNNNNNNNNNDQNKIFQNSDTNSQLSDKCEQKSDKININCPNKIEESSATPGRAGDSDQGPPLSADAGRARRSMEPHIHAKAIRLIADCSRALNKNTRFRPSEMDDIKSVISKIAPYTNTGYVISLDISEAFHSFKLDPSLYPFFCILHPRLGPVHYTRCAQGWKNSPQSCRDNLLLILSDFYHHSVRYLDDVIIGCDSWNHLLGTLDKLLSILNRYNLRLKGKKMTIISKELNFVGRTIKLGEICPSPHHRLKLINYDHANINTKKCMKSFLGLCAFLAEFKINSTEILNDFRKLSEGNLKDKIIWTPELVSKFNKVKTKMNKLINLKPYVPEMQTYLVIDTSFIATGGSYFKQKATRSTF